jgi:hypothetical protein
VLFAGRPLEWDVSAGRWIAERTDDTAWAAVVSFLPRGFPAYCRVLHPAWRYHGDDDVEVRWAEVAAHNGTVAHPHMTWVGITGDWDYRDEDSQPPVWDRAPDEGHLPTTVATRLTAVLRRHTTTPDDCWFGVWHGHDSSLELPAPTLELPSREHWLLRGPIELAEQNMADEPSEQSVNLWWPADRAWCVATELDSMSTYVGGSTACIAELLQTPDLEVLPAAPDDVMSLDSDPINPIPPRD